MIEMLIIRPLKIIADCVVFIGAPLIRGSIEEKDNYSFC
jgi:hypothetical protein